MMLNWIAGWWIGRLEAYGAFLQWGSYGVWKGASFQILEGTLAFE
jgi:hypothetical protein